MNYCEWIVEWHVDEGGSLRQGMLADIFERCGKIAHFKSDTGLWYCAEHWDKHIVIAKKNYDQGICNVCNCEFYDGECNCGFYSYG